jgi:hypothetical protein
MPLLALLLTMLPALAALETGDAFPWFEPASIVEFGPRQPSPFKMEHLRGAPIVLLVMDRGCANKRTEYEYLGKHYRALRQQGVHIYGVCAFGQFATDQVAATEYAAPILIVDDGILRSLGPIDEVTQHRALLIDGNGHVSFAGAPAFKESDIERARTGSTLHGRWQALARPFIPGTSPDGEIQKLRSLLNTGDLGKTVQTMRKLTANKNPAIASEATFIVEECQAWITAATALEAEATAQGDPYLAWLIADALAKELKGLDEGSAAKDRAKELKKSEGYSAGKKFYDAWASTWGKDPQQGQKVLAQFLKSNPDGPHAPLIKAWLGLPAD